MSQNTKCIDLKCTQNCCNILGYCPSSGKGPDTCQNKYNMLRSQKKQNVASNQDIYIIVTIIMVVVLLLLVCFIRWLYRTLKNSGILQPTDYPWNETKNFEPEPPKLQKKKSSKKQKDQKADKQKIGSSKDLELNLQSRNQQTEINEDENEEMQDNIQELKKSQKIRRIRKKKSLYLQEQVIIQKQIN